MSYNFKKLNSKVLSFDPIKDIEKIRFNHYIMRKENKNRLTGEFENGKFKMTIGIVMKDLNLSKSKAERMIREFEKLGIIKAVVKGNISRGYSIYEYVTEGKGMKENDEDFKEDYKNENCVNKFIDKCDDINIYSDNFDKVDLYNFKKEYEKDNKSEVMNSKTDNININLNNNICDNIIDYLNKKAKKNFRKNTPKTRKLINTRLKEGFLEEDFYSVIDIKSSQWLYTDMEKYLRPETLFSNKFEGYLNEVTKEIGEVEPVGQWDIEFDF